MRVVVTLSILASLFVSTRLHAQTDPPVPSVCDTVQESGFFAIGVRKGRSLAAQVIARAMNPVDVCSNLEGVDEVRVLTQGIVDTLFIPPGASERVQCHVAGQVAGMLAQIQDLQDECVGLCIADGLFVGEISGRLYCALSIALGGLVPVELFERLPTDACGTHFQVACDTGFLTVSSADPLCLPFTEVPHAEVYAAVRHNQCTENPGEPTP